ncbi:hypothetical protein F511_44262 [Dorcoceras hygrometricum]|uniref:Uncharacterized protein n=1 Tax=Dorcoceras hygrometricum TaxID=472368 RepID=A0A2Z6ZY42_9LAMI|nr:hypothetical protein F511_44262 [Dorcoceras hygrometricum]
MAGALPYGPPPGPDGSNETSHSPKPQTEVYSARTMADKRAAHPARRTERSPRPVLFLARTSLHLDA